MKPYFEDLLEREINSTDQLEQWFKDKSELSAVISEDLGWRYINMTRYTDNEKYSDAYKFFCH